MQLDRPSCDPLPASVIDEQLFAVLLEECREALKLYIAEAEKTCAVLSQFKGKRLDMNGRQRITAQCSTENEMQHRYMRVRERLFETIQLRYESAGA
jgi:hypothetical protein